jgi:KUP system potassium uptake protein
MNTLVKHFSQKNEVPHPNTVLTSKKKLVGLALAALGIVYGDIGTSPLYAVNAIFLGHGKTSTTPFNVIGAISLVFWVLTIVVAIKYIFLVLRADNGGEGGAFALYAKIGQYKDRKGVFGLMLLLTLAAGLMIGDGIITPAISVLSAVEGLKVAAPALGGYVVPITLIILIGLFVIQRKGTYKIGILFGPILVLWFIAIAVSGIAQIIYTPAILQALNPINGIIFLFHNSFFHNLLIMGAVVLAVTGGEALFADMGHFGRNPIRLSWFGAVYPALILNYLGQGAYVLANPQVPGKNIFYGMIPTHLLYPMVILATLATIIASQALISGAFSLAQQAIAMGLIPRLKVRHTHHHHEGQIYVGFINWTLLTGCLLLVLHFKNSTALAAAYGFSVSGDMLITSMVMIFITIFIWKWNSFLSLLLWIPLILLDLSFFISNSLKFFDGGFIPVTLGILIFIIIRTWRGGRKLTNQAYSEYPSMTVQELIDLKEKQSYLSERSVILLTPKSIESTNQKTPALFQLYWDRYRTLPKHLVFVNIKPEKIPYITDDRCTLRYFQRDPKAGSIADLQIRFGFMEEQDVEEVLIRLAQDKKIDLAQRSSDWSVEASQEHLVPGKNLHIWKRLLLNLFLFLRHISIPAYYHYGLGKGGVNLSLEIMPIAIQK